MSDRVETNASKVVLVTGASRGIGAACALLAAERGFRVVVGYRDDHAAGDAVVRAIGQAGGRAVALRADVSREADVLALFSAIDGEFGRLDALVNNAGVVAPASRMVDYSLERMRRIFDVNVLGSFLCAREALRRMSTRLGGAGGAIVNISSVAAKLGSPNEYVDYAASKGAIDSMTIGLSREVAAEGVRVNAVRPGLIATEIHASGGAPDRVERLKHLVPMRRGGTAAEVAAAVLWLISEEASYVSGALLDVGGGR
ncbi:MAG: SDR family oxidoreductase [Burkholderiaceae bacterium]|nr:SDR family oxidoreductase [Burkholderiaceae bacterium]